LSQEEEEEDNKEEEEEEEDHPPPPPPRGYTHCKLQCLCRIVMVFNNT
jgi:hypothetical protein